MLFFFPGSHDAAPQAPSVLKSFDLNTGALKERYPLPTPGAFCNDIAVGSDDTAYVSDTENMEVDRLRNGSHQLQVWAGNGGFGPKGGVLDGISVLGNRLFVNTLETRYSSVAVMSGCCWKYSFPLDESALNVVAKLDLHWIRADDERPAKVRLPFLKDWTKSRKSIPSSVIRRSGGFSSYGNRAFAPARTIRLCQ